MPPPLQLERFDVEHARPWPDAVDEAAVEESRLAAYEKGYSAGWEDAVIAQADDQSRVREDLARNLHDLSFTFEEARTHVLKGLEGLLRGMVDRILPDLARATLGTAVVARVMSEAVRGASVPIEVVVAPTSRAAVERALGDRPAVPVSLVEEPSLGEGQVHFRLGGEEHVLDIDALVAAIQSLVADYLAETTEGERRRG